MWRLGLFDGGVNIGTSLRGTGFSVQCLQIGVTMFIGVPKEMKTDEYRVSLIPATVSELASRGHERRGRKRRWEWRRH